MNHWFKNISSSLLLILTLTCSGHAQVIDWKSYYTNATISAFKDQDISFGNLMYNGGTYSIDINDAGKSTISVTGIKFLTVLVEVDATTHLYLNGNSVDYDGDPQKSIPFDLQASYQNRGLPSNNISASQDFVVDGNNYASKIIPLFSSGNGPPGPPPTPQITGVTTETSTAYIYLYGSLNVGEQASGSYSGNVGITITYN